MLRKDDPAFKKLVDDTLADLIRTGEFERLDKKWFQSPIPLWGITLDVPKRRSSPPKPVIQRKPQARYCLRFDEG